MNQNRPEGELSTSGTADGTDIAGPSGRTAEPGETGEMLKLDDIFEILKNPRRRHAVEYLRGRDEQVTLSDLAEHIAAVETDTTVDTVTSQQRKRVYVGLYQCHLPKMDDKDVIDYNKDRGMIAKGPNLHLLEPYLSVTESEESNWHRYYLFCVIAGWALLGVTSLGGRVYGLTSDLVLPLILVPITGIVALQAFGDQSVSL